MWGWDVSWWVIDRDCWSIEWRIWGILIASEEVHLVRPRPIFATSRYSLLVSEIDSLVLILTGCLCVQSGLILRMTAQCPCPVSSLAISAPSQIIVSSLLGVHQFEQSLFLLSQLLDACVKSLACFVTTFDWMFTFGGWLYFRGKGGMALGNFCVTSRTEVSFIRFDWL